MFDGSHWVREPPECSAPVIDWSRTGVLTIANVHLVDLVDATMLPLVGIQAMHMNKYHGREFILFLSLQGHEDSLIRLVTTECGICGVVCGICGVIYGTLVANRLCCSIIVHATDYAITLYLLEMLLLQPVFFLTSWNWKTRRWKGCL